MLKEALAEKGISPAELARRIHRSDRMVYYYLSGQWPISPGTAKLIAFSTGIPVRVILGDGKEA